MSFSRNTARYAVLMVVIITILSAGLFVTPVTPTFAQSVRPPQQCLSVVGDSVAQGGAVYEIPGVGYTSVLTVSIAKLAGDMFRAHGKDLHIFDRSVGASGINSPLKRPYLQTWDYAQLLRDRCQYTFIMPFVNDLTTNTAKEIAAPQYAATVVQIVKQITQRNPLGLIFIGNFYLGAPKDFAVRGYAGGMNRDKVIYYNSTLTNTCAGPLSAFKQVTCVNLPDALPMDQDWYLEGDINRKDFEASLVSWVDPSQQPLLKYYWTKNPDGMLTGDRLHLNLPGKTKVTELLVGIALQKPVITEPPPPPATPSGAYNATVAIGPLSMRSGPGTGFDILASFDGGVRFVLDGRDSSGKWAHGTSETGMTGWVAAGFLRLAKGLDINALPVVTG